MQKNPSALPSAGNTGKSLEQATQAMECAHIGPLKLQTNKFSPYLTRQQILRILLHEHPNENYRGIFIEVVTAGLSCAATNLLPERVSRPSAHASLLFSLKSI
jgi:hypothetical protein